MKKILIVFFLFINFCLPAQKEITVSGIVAEKNSKEPLIGVAIFHPQTERVIFTNSYGFYSLSLPPQDTVMLLYGGSIYGIDTIYLPFRKNLTYNVELQQAIVLENIVIQAEKQNSDVVQMSTITMNIQDIKRLPAQMGEKDLLKSLILMPGIQNAVEGFTGLIVRGGSPDQNLILLDGAPVYNAGHLMGFFSLFNGSSIRSAETYKAGFPAEYGGRLSSIIDVKMKDGHKESYHGEGGVGILSSYMTIEGPIIKNKASFMISGRRSWTDLLMIPIMKIINPEMTASAYFFDLNAKFNYDISDKDKLFVSGYFGRDKFGSSFQEDKSSNAKMGMYWQNGIATARWNHIFSNKLFSNLSFIFSDYDMNIYMHTEQDDTYLQMDLKSGIRDYTLKYDFNYHFTNSHIFNIGISSTLHQSSPNIFSLQSKDENLSQSRKSGEPVFGVETAVYFEDAMNFKNKLKITPGIHLAMFNVKDKTYFSPEPRLSISYNVRKDLAIKISYAMMKQFLMLMSNTTIGMPTDLWLPITKDIKPQRSQQIALGLAYDLPKPKLSFTIEGYYKKMDNIIAMKEGTSFMMAGMMDAIENAEVQSPKWMEMVTAGQAWAYGAEFMVQKKHGKFTGWLAYTLSWIQHQFDELNFGKKYFARYDRRHDLAIVLMYSPTPKINLTVTWVYATGNAVTLPDQRIYSQDIANFIQQYNNHSGLPDDYIYDMMLVETYGEKNNLRMEAFHHLDIGIQFIKPHKKRKGESIFEISVYNVYNHRNPFFYYTEGSFIIDGEKSRLMKLSIFPIIPSFTYHFKF